MFKFKLQKYINFCFHKHSLKVQRKSRSFLRVGKVDEERHFRILAILFLFYVFKKDLSI